MKPHLELVRDHAHLKVRGPSHRREEDREHCYGGGCCAQVNGMFALTGVGRPARADASTTSSVLSEGVPPADASWQVDR